MSNDERPELHRLCGLKDLPSSGTHWHEVITAGLPVRGIRSMARVLEVKDTELADLLGVDEATLADKEGTLSRDVSNFLYRIALTLSRTVVKTAGDVEKATAWMRSAQPTLKGYVPILLLQSHIGTEYVFAAIERMELPKDRVIQSEEAPDAGTAEFEHNFDGEEDDGDNPFDEEGDDE
jgi:putative toxin-antitoxin system antitoxin component (TIGR02293 family)